MINKNKLHISNPFDRLSKQMTFKFIQAMGEASAQER